MIPELSTCEQELQYRLVKCWGRDFNLLQKEKRLEKEAGSAEEIVEDCDNLNLEQEVK